MTTTLIMILMFVMVVFLGIQMQVTRINRELTDIIDEIERLARQLEEEEEY